MEIRIKINPADEDIESLLVLLKVATGQIKKDLKKLETSGQLFELTESINNFETSCIGDYETQIIPYPTSPPTPTT